MTADRNSALPVRVAACAWIVAGTLAAADPAGAAPPTVGIEGRLTVLAPTGALDVLPLSRTNRLLARIVATQPVPGPSNRYDIRYIGLTAGPHDLHDVLRGMAVVGTDRALIVPVAGLLPTNHNGALAYERAPAPDLHVGYRWLMRGLWLAWLCALVPLLALGRPQRAAEPTAPVVTPPTTAELLAPLVARAAAGTLSTEDKARLEHLLMELWSARMPPADVRPETLRNRVRADADAGQLLAALEQWLYAPPGRYAGAVGTLLARCNAWAADSTDINGSAR